jgi:hypothetical protein
MSSGLSPTAICASYFLLAVVAFAAHTSPLVNEERALHDLQQPCPLVSVSCPAEYKDGDPLTFTATISGGDPKVVPVFSWSVSEGRIVQGQGTSSIIVDLTGFGSQIPTGIVTVSGFDSACPATASCTLPIVLPAPPSKKFDSYGVLPRKEEVRRLNAYAIELQNQPGSQAYILAYGGRRGSGGEAQRLAAKTQEYLVKSRGIDAGRIVTMDAGYKEKSNIDLWIVPTGATPPVAEPTVDPSEVQIIQTGKGKPSKH